MNTDNRRLQALIHNPLFITGVVIILINLMISLGGAIIRPDSTPFANDQHLELMNLKPGTKVSFLKIARKELQDQKFGIGDYFVGVRRGYDLIPFDSMLLEGSLVRLKNYHRQTWSEIPILDVYYPLDGNTSSNQSITNGKKIQEEVENLKPNLFEDRVYTRTYYLGSDKYGRDLLSRLMSGAYISLSVGFIAVFISLVLGIFLGTIAGYFRGWVDRLIVWVINVIWSIPTLLLVIAITLVLGKGFWQIFIAVGLTMWVEVARIVRGQVMGIREKEYVEAGIVLGYSNFRIIRYHILPNILSPIIVISAANFASAILLEAGLSFLGIGAPPPQATWGKMISEHKSYLITGDAHLAIFPGIAIMLLVLSFTIIGNSLRDALDERNQPSR